MANGDQVKIASDEGTYRLYMVESIGGIKADVRTLTRDSSEQFRRLNKLESEGCAKGHALQDQIADLKRAPKRTLWVRGALGGGGSAAILWLCYELFKFLVKLHS